ncbi:MAG TPA: hypothetical protein PKL81_16995, partial [Ferruginibacter sp.]|nr:hypothetical protein [Ferruginibacter sp.]
EKLAAGRVNDWPFQGVCSSPLVEGEILYYVTNRCEIVALDTKGFSDKKNDGLQDEKFKGEKDAAAKTSMLRQGWQDASGLGGMKRDAAAAQQEEHKKLYCFFVHAS